jgi:hypothetical protein
MISSDILFQAMLLFVNGGIWAAYHFSLGKLTQEPLKVAHKPSAVIEI